jgi:hypothetical protein
MTDPIAHIGSGDPYDHIELTEDEVKEAIRQGKIKKYFKEKHQPYWTEQEQKKPKDK